jgi:hypothetical protein
LENIAPPPPPPRGRGKYYKKGIRNGGKNVKGKEKIVKIMGKMN